MQLLREAASQAWGKVRFARSATDRRLAKGIGCRILAAHAADDGSGFLAGFSSFGKAKPPLKHQVLHNTSTLQVLMKARGLKRVPYRTGVEMSTKACLRTADTSLYTKTRME